MIVTAGLAAIGTLPTAAIAGVVTVPGVGLVDRRSHALARRWWRGDDRPALQGSLGVVALVAAATIAGGVGWGVAIGTAMSAIVFMRTLHRQLVRARYDASAAPSRRSYPEADEAALAPARGGIRMLELEGALFSGNVERFAAEVERAGDGASDVVVDLRRVTALDASAAVALTRADRHLSNRLSAASTGWRHAAE